MRIEEKVSQHTGYLDVTLGRIGEAVERLKELRVGLISAAVTGKIDVRSASAEVAGDVRA